MAATCHGMISAKAVLTFDGSEEKLTVGKGDTLTNLVHSIGAKAAISESVETIESCEVGGLFIRPAPVYRTSSAIIDGVPTNAIDPTGEARYGLVEEVAEIYAMLVYLPGEDDEMNVPRIVNVNRIISIESVESADDGEGD